MLADYHLVFFKLFQATCAATVLLEKSSRGFHFHYKRANTKKKANKKGKSYHKKGNKRGGTSKTNAPKFLPFVVCIYHRYRNLSLFFLLSNRSC
jgi:hypothetical protein